MENVIFDLLNWYSYHKRSLPWREDHNPYHVWISEVMLQQTRIEAVIQYYQRFLKELPTIYDLAKVEDDRLMKLWEGLGYYSRARNLKRAAEIVVEKYHGVFPSTYAEIITLPGIGEYTASAIASICFHEKKATVDGNVLRVYTRFFEDYSNVDDIKTRKKVKIDLEKIIPNESGNFNEALMEVGEVVCLPNGLPHCSKCPFCSKCLANKNNTYMELPVKKAKKNKKVFNYTVFIFVYQGRIALKKRENQKILSQLWEFPNILGKFNLQQARDYLDKQFILYRDIRHFISNTHIFTHQKWVMDSYIVVLGALPENFKYIFESIETIQNKYAIPTAFRPFLNEIMKNDLH